MPALLLFVARSAPPTSFRRVLDDRLQIQLVAAEPDVVTPTGIAVDDKGRVLVIESHTHFRPEGYNGPDARPHLAAGATSIRRPARPARSASSSRGRRTR